MKSDIRTSCGNALKSSDKLTTRLSSSQSDIYQVGGGTKALIAQDAIIQSWKPVTRFMAQNYIFLPIYTILDIRRSSDSERRG